LTAEILIAGIAIAFLAAVCYSVTGFGFALVMTPLLTVAWEVKPAVAVSVLLATLGLIPLLVGARGHVDVTRVAVLTLASLAGIPIGLALLEYLDSDALKVVIATTVIASSLLLYFAPQMGGERDTLGGRVTSGFLGGVLGSSTSMGGPPVVLYLLTRVREVPAFRATLLAYFLPGNIVTIVGLVIIGRVTGNVLLLCAAAAPAVLLGLFAGASIRTRIPPDRFRGLVVGLLVVMSLSVLISTVAGG
jgi:uncharacterized membrane protein YfcA